jgi:hypothetical protein
VAQAAAYLAVAAERAQHRFVGASSGAAPAR